MKDYSKIEIERKSSIEREPQTVSPDQIRCAREAALYVVSTHSEEEAMRIFTEGLQPVHSTENGNMSMMDWDEDDEEFHRVAGDNAIAGLRERSYYSFLVLCCAL